MAKLILKNPVITINGVDLSHNISKVTVATTFNQVDVTSFGDTYKEILQGIGDASISCDFFQDYAANEVDATLAPLALSGSVFPITVKPTSATVSSTNPVYTMSAICADYNPVDGAVGAASTMSVTFPNAGSGTAGLSRGTA